MNKLVFSLVITFIVLLICACTNNENIPAKAGTADSAGIGHQKGKGTPYPGDSAVNRQQPDTVTNE